MEYKIVKRDGSYQGYNPHKIRLAVNKSLKSAHKDYFIDTQEYHQMICNIEENLQWKQVQENGTFMALGIEDIQDVVEQNLAKHPDLFLAAKNYILYREKQKQIREDRNFLKLNSIMDEYLGKEDWRVDENANVNYSLGGLILYNSGKVTANYWLNQIYTPEIAQAHNSCAFHIHDLSMFSPYCAGWSIRQVIEKGINGVPGKMESAPARHLSTIVNQLVNFLGIMQNEWAGAQAFSSFDTYLAPFVRVDHLDYATVKQCIQNFLFGVNTPSRWGSQSPFTNITLDWVCPKDLRDKKALVGGKELDFTYGECQEEMDLINRAFLELMIEGDANGRGFSYPIPTYNITPDFIWDSANAQMLFDLAGKYGTPYFQNFVNSDLNPEDVRSMCCRLQLDKRELRKRGGGLFGSDEFTGSIGVVTLNLPQIGYKSKTKKEFFENLEYLMDLASESLTIKRKTVIKLMDRGLFPYTSAYLKFFHNHFATIGICGMNEALLNFMGQDITTSEGKDFATQIMDFMRDKMQDYQERTGDLYNLEATPAESTSYRLAKHDKKNYPDIITSGTKEPYYTNSTQLPVMFTEDIFEALEHQNDLQTKYTGGTVFHTFLGSSVSGDIVKKLLKKMTTEYKIPYMTFSPAFSICPVHHYIEGEQYECPRCLEEQRSKTQREIEEIQKILQERDIS